MRKKNLAIRLVTIFMLLTPSPLSTAFSSIHVATCMAQQFDKVVDNTPDSIAKALSARAYALQYRGRRGAGAGILKDPEIQYCGRGDYGRQRPEPKRLRGIWEAAGNAGLLRK